VACVKTTVSLAPVHKAAANLEFLVRRTHRAERRARRAL
jgi:hypothetical protein